jgi:autotransporter-associated beta strand protein
MDMSRVKAILCLAGVMGLLAGRAQGATYYWDTDGASGGFGDTAGTWGSSAFWSTDSTGASGTANTTITTGDGVNFGTDTLALGSTAAAVGVSGAVNVNSITFGSAQANAVTLSGGTSITLGGTTPAITVSNAADTISSVLAGSSFTKAGNGTLTLSGNNTHTGTTTINGGILKLQGGAFLTTTRNYSITSGAVLNLDGASINKLPTGTSTISGAGTLRLTGGIVFGNTVSGGIFNLSLASGAVIDVQAGASMQNGGWSAFNWAACYARLNVDGQFNMGDALATVDALTGAGTITKGWDANTRVLTVGIANGSGTFSGTIANGTGTIALTKTGTGTQTLSGNNNYSGVTSIGNGILAIAHNNALGNTTGNTTIAANGSSTGPQLRLSGNITSPEPISLTGNSDQNQYNGVIYNTSGINTISGNITLSSPAGTIRITSGGGELILGGTITQTGTTRILNLQANTGAAITVNNAIANNNGALNVLGTAAGGASAGVTLKAASAAIGATTVVENGLLKLGVTDALKTSANLTLGVAQNFSGNGGFDFGTFDLAGFNQTVNALIGTKNAGFTIGADSNRKVTNSAASGTSTLTVGNGDGSGTFNGVILDGATAKVALTKTGTGTQTLVGESTYSGPTIVLNGILSLTHLNAMQYSPLDTASSVTGDGTKGLKTDQINLKLGGLSGNKDLAAIFTTSSGGYGSVSTVTLNAVAGAALSYSGIIANGAADMALTKAGAGSQTLSGANTYTGLTDVQAGTLTLDRSGGAIADTAAVRVSGGTLNVAQAETVGAVTLTSGTISGVAALTGSSYALSGSGTVSAELAGAGIALTKTGAGTATLSGVNTYSGATTVGEGTLLVNNPGSLDAASAVTVTAGTIGGNGTINGNVTVDAAGSVAPGDGAGTLSIGGNLDISALANGGSGKLKFGLAATGSSDQIAVGGSLTIGTGVLGVSDFEFTDLGGLQAGTYTLITSAGISDTLAAGDLTGTVGAFNCTLQKTGNNLELVTTTAGPPYVVNVSSELADGRYDAGTEIDIDVTFDHAVLVIGSPTLLIETGATDREASFFGGSGTTTLTFRHTVQSGDTNGELDYTGTGALELNAGSIKDSLDQNADLALPAPGLAGSLGDSKDIVIDTVAPTLAGANIVDDKGGGTVPIGLVTYTVTFSEDMDATTVTAADFSNAGTAPISIGTITETSPGEFTVEVSPISGGTLQLRVIAAAVLTDAAGNALDTASAIPDDTTITVTIPTCTWDANAGTAGQTDGAGLWLNANQWWTGSANATWTSGYDAIFGNGGGGGAVTLASPTTVHTLTFNSFSGTYTLGTAGQTITLIKGITKNAGGTAATIISPITLGMAQTWTNNSAGLLTIGTGAVGNGGNLLTIDGTGNTTITSAISGAGGLTKSGSGVLYLNNEGNSYSGPTIVTGGALQFGAGWNQGAQSLPGGISNNSNTGSNLEINGGNVRLAYYLLRALGAGPGQLQVTGGTSGFSSCQGSTPGANSIKLNNDLNYEIVWGSAYWNPSVLVLNDAAAGATVQIELGNKIDLNGATRTVSANSATYPGRINGVIRNGSGTAGLTKTGSGELVLAANNSFNGPVTVNQGTLTLSGINNVASANPLGQSPAAAANLVLANGTTLKYSGGAASSDRGFTISGTADGHSATLDASCSGALNLTSTSTPAYGTGNQSRKLILTGTSTSANTLAASIADNGSGKVALTKTGAGTWVLTGNCSYSGDTVVTNGILRLTGNTVLSQFTTVYLSTGSQTGTIDLAFTGTQMIAALYIDGVLQSTAVPVGANGTTITGTGFLSSGGSGTVYLIR